MSTRSERSTSSLISFHSPTPRAAVRTNRKRSLASVNFGSWRETPYFDQLRGGRVRAMVTPRCSRAPPPPHGRSRAYDRRLPRSPIRNHHHCIPRPCAPPRTSPTPSRGRLLLRIVVHRELALERVRRVVVRPPPPLVALDPFDDLLAVLHLAVPLEEDRRVSRDVRHRLRRRHAPPPPPPAGRRRRRVASAVALGGIRIALSVVGGRPRSSPRRARWR